MKTPEDGDPGDDLLDALHARLRQDYGDGLVGGEPLDLDAVLMCVLFMGDPDDLSAAAEVVGLQRLREVLAEMVSRGMLWGSPRPVSRGR